jgi:hypothetical protein
MEYKIDCVEIKQDHHEMGLQIGFHAKDKTILKQGETSMKKILASMGDYFSINTTYGEDDCYGDYEDDYLYCDSTFEEFNGELADFNILFTKTKMLVSCGPDNLEISYKIKPKAYEKLLENLAQIDPENKYIKSA